MLRRRIPLFVLLTLLGVASLAQAQTNAQELSDANRSAMDAYNNLDIESAKKQLEEAARNAEKNGVKGPALARTYANLGIIYVGGLSDNGAGLDAFVKALKQDPNVEPDPLVSTPEIQQVYTLAKRKAGVSAGGGSSAPQVPAVTGPVEGNLEHIPAPEQLSQTAVPVFVTVGDLKVASVKVFYRALGMPQPKSLDLKPMRNGWGALIPCTDVFEPNVEYFIVALDDEGAQVGNAGTPQNPVSVPIVTTRSSPSPSLPGELPPSQCTGDSECPPGMPGCGGRAGLGDTCRADKDCGDGMVCQDNFCATGERSDEPENEDTSDIPRFYLELSAGVGLPYVGKGMEADAAPPANVAVAACNVGYGNDPNPAGSNGQCITSGSLDLALAQKYTEDRGWACDVVETDDGGITLRNCTVAIQSPGFVPQVPIVFGLGYFITPRFSLGLAGRIQLPGGGEGTMAGILANVRGEYLVTQPKVKGFQTSLMFGAGVGRIMAQPPAQTNKAKGPYVTSGLGNVQAGARIGYRVSRNIGINAMPVVNFMMPAFLFDLDLLANLQVLF